MRGRRLLAAAALVGVGALTVSACGTPGFSGLYNIPLPGGASLGSHPYTVTADFADALDLVPQSAVRVNDVPVGRVHSITLSPDGRTAEVKLDINGSVHLPANATALVQQTSLLGEKYVALSAPAGVPSSGTLTGGMTIPVSRTDQGIQVEQVFGALSLLLNGGGLGQLQTINTELNKAAGGHEADFRSMLTSLDSVVSQLNAHRTDITTALDQLDTLSSALRQNDAKIATVLSSLSPGLQVLAGERTQLVAMLTALNHLSTVTVSTVNASQANFVADLKLLSPILSQLAAAGQALPDSLQVLLTYPFPDGALSAIKGDYLNTFITMDLQTPGGSVVSVQPQLQPGLATVPPASSSSASASASASAPPTLLPATSSVSAGLSTSVLTTTSTGSASTTPSGSPSGSTSASASGSPSPTGSGSAGTSGTPVAPTTSSSRSRRPKAGG